MQNKFNCFRDTAYSSYPILINNIYDGILKYDFFTNAIQNTPKIFTSWILKIPYIFGMDWYNGVYLLHVLLNIIYLPLLFICINRILNQFFLKENSNFLKILFVRLLTFVLVWSRVVEFIQSRKSPMGWPNAFYTPYFNAEPDEFSLIFGLFFLYFIFGNFKYKNLLCPVLLGLCIFFHALYGLAIFSLAMVYYISSRDKYYGSTISYNFIFGLFFPSLLLFLKYGSQNYLSSKYLDQCTMYSTLEPCPMCAGALFWSQLGALIIGARDLKRGFSLLKPVPLHPKTKVRFGILESDCEAKIKNFFKKLRNKEKER